MKKYLLVPAMIFPYTVCLCLASGFMSQSFSDAAVKVFGTISVITFVLAFLCNLIFIFTSGNTPVSQMLKAALLIKIIHIPTYIVFFILGMIMGLVFLMTFPFILFLMFIDVLTLLISSMVSVYSIIKGLREKGENSKFYLVITLLCQFLWCADIISLFIASAIKKSETSTDSIS